MQEYSTLEWGQLSLLKLRQMSQMYGLKKNNPVVETTLSETSIALETMEGQEVSTGEEEGESTGKEEGESTGKEEGKSTGEEEGESTGEELSSGEDSKSDAKVRYLYVCTITLEIELVVETDSE